MDAYLSGGVKVTKLGVSKSYIRGGMFKVKLKKWKALKQLNCYSANCDISHFLLVIAMIVSFFTRRIIAIAFEF